jgi:hypothetical protein
LALARAERSPGSGSDGVGVGGNPKYSLGSSRPLRRLTLRVDEALHQVREGEARRVPPGPLSERWPRPVIQGLPLFVCAWFLRSKQLMVAGGCPLSVVKGSNPVPWLRSAQRQLQSSGDLDTGGPCGGPKRLLQRASRHRNPPHERVSLGGPGWIRACDRRIMSSRDPLGLRFRP